MENFDSIMDSYEILSALGGLLQLILVITKKAKNNFLMAIGVLMDAVGLSGMSFGYFLKNEPAIGYGCIAGLIVDIAFVVYIIYKDEHPKKN